MDLEIFRHPEEQPIKLIWLALKNEFPVVIDFRVRAIGIDFFSIVIPHAENLTPAERDQIFFYAGYSYATLKDFDPSTKKAPTPGKIIRQVVEEHLKQNPHFRPEIEDPKSDNT